MDLELDHFFILTDKPQEAGDLLVAMGLKESFRRDHKGQGTSNRRFEFSNGMLEILYVRDGDEANNGPAKDLRFPERVQSSSASPFGIILNRLNDKDLGRPFKGWDYQPDYFEPPMAFHVGSNSELLEEPLCIYVPFMAPVDRKEEAGTFKSIHHVQISVPSAQMSETLAQLDNVKRLQVVQGDEHLVEMTLDRGTLGKSKDVRPLLPLVIHW